MVVLNTETLRHGFVQIGLVFRPVQMLLSTVNHHPFFSSV